MNARGFIFAVGLLSLGCASWAAESQSPVGKKFWIGSTSDRAQPISFISRAEVGFTRYGLALRAGQTFTIESAAQSGKNLQYRIAVDDGRTLFLDADDFERALFSPKRYRDQSEQAFGWEQHLFTGPPAPFLAKAAAAAKAARSASAAAGKENSPRPGVHIGITAAEALRSSWGRPDHVNRTITALGVDEQWVYPNGNFLYFENGILTAIQN